VQRGTSPYRTACPADDLESDQAAGASHAGDGIVTGLLLVAGVFPVSVAFFDGVWGTVPGFGLVLAFFSARELVRLVRRAC
jgi:hypothetical protein